MSTIIKYTNDLDELITQQQVSLLTRYKKLYFIDGELKKRERFVDNELWGGTYFISPSEDLNIVLTDLNPSLKWSIGSNKEVVGNYTVWKYLSYNENLQLESEYSKMVTDNNGFKVAIIMFDTVTNQPKGAFKVFVFGGRPYYGGGVIEGYYEEGEEITFYFNEDGSINEISMDGEYVDNESYWTNINDFLNEASEFIAEVMSPEEIAYFTNVLPVVPNF